MKNIKNLILIVFFIILQTSQPAFADKKHDINLIKEINKKLENIENNAVNDRKKLDKLMLSAFNSKDTSKATANKRGEQLEKLVTNITNTLKSSMEINPPSIQNEKAKTHIEEAIDAHKHWAIAQQGELKSIFEANSDDFKNFEEESKHYAEIEAYSLLLADKVIENDK